MKYFYLVIFINLSIFFTGKAQQFTDVTPDELKRIPYQGSIKWADMDNDGKLELIYTGYLSYNENHIKIFKEDQNGFKIVYSNNTFGGNSNMSESNLEVGDFDGDGDLDLLISGSKGLKILRNDENFVFTDLDPSSYNNLHGAVYWGDGNNDGLLDILYSGPYGHGIINNPKQKYGHGFPSGSYVVPFQSWADFNSDGYLDIIQTRKTFGSYGSFIGNYLLTKKSDGTYSEKALDEIPFLIDGIEYADFNNDGKLDFLVKSNSGEYTLFKSEGEGYIKVETKFPYANSAKWADLNNDGFIDVILTGGSDGINLVTKIYFNYKGEYFYDSKILGLPAFERGLVNVGDYDRDGDVDFALIGYREGRIFKNNWIESGGKVNAAPLVPKQINEVVNFNSVKLTWDKTTDAETPSLSLTYNLLLKDADGTEIIPSHVNRNTKTRSIYTLGNAYLSDVYELKCLKEGTYYWSIQSLDNSYQGSPFSNERSFTINNIKPKAPTNLKSLTISDKAIQLGWTDVSTTESEYKIYRKDKFSEFEQEYYEIATLPKNTTSYIDSDYLLPDFEYLYKVTAVNCSYPDEFSAEVEAKTFKRPFEFADIIPFESSKPVGRVALLGDYDNDKDLDLLLSFSYEYTNYSKTTKLYKYENDQYIDSGLEFPYLNSYSSAQWIDLNKDGYLDLIFVLGEPFSFEIKIFINDKKGDFKETVHSLFFDFRTIWQGGLSFIDFDNDGDLDLLVQGFNISFGKEIKLLLNNGNNEFLDSKIAFNKDLILKSTKPWGDFDNDGFLDLLLSKEIDCHKYKMVILKNIEGKEFVEIDLDTSEGLNYDLLNFSGDYQWGDYDNDGYLDFMISGQNTCGNGNSISLVYHNEKNGKFKLLETPEIVSENNDVKIEWGDFNNDGFYDIFLYGDPFGGNSDKTRIYQYKENQFLDSGIDYFLHRKQHGTMVIGDIDNDKDLDIIILGEKNYTHPAISIYKNNYSNGWNIINQAPSAPQNLRSQYLNNQLKLTWDHASDAETKSEGLTYNIYLIHDNDTLIVPNSHADGYRKIVSQGNVQHNTSITIKNLGLGEYKWGVQAIDKSYFGGPFAISEKTVDLLTEIEDRSTFLLIYPNPISDNLLKYKTSIPTNIQIINSFGKEVLNGTINGEGIIDVGSWKPGMFILRYRDSEGYKFKKLIKI